MEISTNELAVKFRVSVEENLEEIITIACNDICRDLGEMYYTVYIDKNKLTDMFKRNQPREVLLYENAGENEVYEPYQLKTWHKLRCECPNCRRVLYVKEVSYTVTTNTKKFYPHVLGSKFKYCYDCGQALDWSNTEFSYDIDEETNKLKVTPKIKEKGV